ncbi:MAG: DUF368 domain-containing protein [Pseudomonadales bacterium]
MTAPQEPAPRSLGDWLGVVGRGVAMGIAELVPGVSGGTIAFVTGIYEELIGTLAGLRPTSLLVLRRAGWRHFWVSHNLTFLLALAFGMVLAVISFARVLGYLLDHVPTLVWGFFFGLIAASVVHIGRYRRPWQLAGYGLLGVLAAVALAQLGVRDGAAPAWLYFVGGMVAVSAWLLPAVSGSFLLLVLGLYEPVLRAFNAGEWLFPGLLLLGCAVGLLLFSRLLHWLMRRQREPVLALLTGFMAGSLPRLWPWHVDGAPVPPAAYEAALGQPAWLGFTVAAVVFGLIALWLLSRLE